MNKDCYTCKLIAEKDEEIAALNELGQEVATDCAKKDKELSKLRRQLEEKERQLAEKDKEIVALCAQREKSTLVANGHPVYRNRHEHYNNYVMTGRTDDGEALYRKEHHVLSLSVGCCSECGKILCSRFNNYCPNCGAKMDGGDNCG